MPLRHRERVTNHRPRSTRAKVMWHLPAAAATFAIAKCALTTALLLVRGRLYQPTRHVGQRLRFADGTTSRVYRETARDGPAPAEPVVLVVSFCLRGVHGRTAHRVFRAESELNTPLFAGFPGFVSKLWLADDERGAYRGLYQWDGATSAEHYVAALWWPLALVSHRASIKYHVLPGITRDDLLDGPEIAGPVTGADWWRPTAVEPAPT